MKTKQEQIEEMENELLAHTPIIDIPFETFNEVAAAVYNMGYRKASDVIDELVDKVFEKIRYEYQNYPNAMTVGTYYQLRKEINELADEMRQEVEK